jgi:tetratricopeptide (TPR) repeat protein
LNQTSVALNVPSKPKGFELFERANAEYDAGRYDNAIALFDEAIANDLKSEVVYNNKGTTLDAMGRYREAAKCYKKAVSIKPAYELAWHNLGNCLYVQELYLEAAEAYAKATKFNPSRRENWSGLAASWSRSGKRKRAAKAVEKLGPFAVSDTSILLLQSDLYLDCGFPQKAIERCEAYIESCPESPVGYTRLGSVAHELGEYNRAIFAFSRALKISPEDKEVWNNLGYTCFSRGYLERAHECFDKAISLDPDYKHAWYNKGYAYHGADMLEEAVRCYKRAIAIDPVDKVLWNNLGNALYNLGRYVESIPKFVTALKVDPDYEIAWNNIGNALEKIGAFKQAIPFHDRSLEINSQFDYAIYAKGVCRSKIGLLEDGYDLIIESLHINPSYDEAWKARASVASKLGRWDDALMAVEQSLLLNPDFDQGWTERGEILLAIGDEEGAQASFEMALKCLEKVNAATSSGMMALVRRGELLARLGKFEEALMNFETVAISRKMDFLSIPKALEMCRLMSRLELPKALADSVEATNDITAKVAYAEFLLDKGDDAVAKNVVLSMSGSPVAGEMLLARARARALAGDGNGAKTLLSWESEPSTEGVLHRLMGELLESRGDFAGAERVYRRRAMNHPSDFSAAVALSRIHLRLKDYRRAIRSADMAIGIDDRDWEPHKIKAEAYAALGDGAKLRTETAQVSARLALVGMRPEDVEPKEPA